MPRVIDNIRKLAVMITIASPLIAVMGWGVDGLARAAEGQLRFTLVAVSEAPITNGVKHLLLLSGHGTFTPGSVNGGGGYLYVDNATKVPKTILSNGTWKATEVLSWTPAEEGATYGSTHPGFLDLRVDLIPKQGPVIHGARDARSSTSPTRSSSSRAAAARTTCSRRRWTSPSGTRRVAGRRSSRRT